jgi:hypothetical protein
MPGEGELSGNRLIVSAKDGIRVRQSEGPWKEDAAGVPPTAARRGLQLACSQRTADVSLAIHLDEQGSAGTTVVNRAWVQTWITPALREDRAVMRLSTTQKNLDFVVPAGVNPAEVELWLDGKRTAGQSTPDLHLIVPLPAAEGLAQHELEAVYQFPAPRPEVGRMSLELPRLGRGAWMHRLYWQLVLPRNEQVMVAPADFTGEFRWGWNGLFWGRIPALEQPQLEAWCGSRRFIEVPADTNRYLFSTLGNVTRCELRTGQRAFIVMAASGAALVIGLLLIYIPAARHPAALFLGAIVLGACAFAYPEATLLVAQAASLGVLLSLAAAVMRRGVVRRHPPSVREISSSIFDRGSSGTSRRVAALASQSAAMNEVPDEAPVSIMDSHE